LDNNFINLTGKFTEKCTCFISMRPVSQMQQELRLRENLSKKCITFCEKWLKRGRSDWNTNKNILFLQCREHM